jgi:hypothetical protein
MIDIIVSKTGDRREFLSGLRVEVGIADAAIQGIVPDSDICQARAVIFPDGKIARHVGHEVVDALVPT